MSKPRLVLDWDGTVTEEDVLVMVLREFGDPRRFRELSDALDRGELTIEEEIRLQFEALATPLDEVVAWVLEHVRVRRGFAELAHELRPLIVSSGFHELIEPVLAREGVELEVRANSVEARPDGWRVWLRAIPTCATCGEPCKRPDLPEDEVVFAGDGYFDRCAALAADRVFARAGLAAFLDEQGIAYEPLTDFHALRAAL
jgi:2-hydroxy-3-keto-5-methylthiopentenyl-1-phosphate phosphatase